MENSLGSRVKRAWNVFMNKDPTYYKNNGYGYSTNPYRKRLSIGNEKTIVSSIYNRIALDVASINIRHVRLDDNGRYKEDVNSGLNECLSLSANIDQTARAFLQDAALSMFDEGVIALVIAEATDDPTLTDSYDIKSLRVGKIIEWKPRHVKVELYNDKTGNRQEVFLPKKSVAIIVNPFHIVMNEPNSTMKRLTHKLSLLDSIDEASSSGKLDLIIQLPYVVKSEQRRQQAEKRLKDIEVQMAGSTYGIAYIDGTEKVTQLNRPVENNLLKQIEYLTSQAYSQLNIDQSILDGTADEKTMLNYFNRTVEPVVSAIVDGIKRTFLSKTARSQGQSIMFFRDPFKLVPVTQLAEIADKLTRNEIATSNEIRQVIGWKPSDNPEADELRNKNLNREAGGFTPDMAMDETMDETMDVEEENQNE